MRLRAFSSIGGLRLYGNPLHTSQVGFNSRNDFLSLKVDRNDLSHLAVSMIKEVGEDASEDLIEICRQVVMFEDNKD
jgi:hypothetical protein